MDRIKLSENFYLDEFLDPDSHEGLEKGLAIAQFLRETTGLPVTINNWSSGGQYKYSGFRPPQCTIGSPTSEHRKLNANDYKIGNWTGSQMQDFVRKHATQLFVLGVRRMEHISLTPTWLHLDCKEHGENCIKIIDLKSVVEKILA